MQGNRTRSSFSNRSTSLLLAAASLATVPLLVGCDNSTGKADRAILEGAGAAVATSTVDESTKNVAELDKLTKEADASTPRKALAKAALAGAELQLAQQIVDDLQGQELLIARKIWEMEQIAGQIQKAKAQIDAASRRDPTEPLPAEIMGEKVVTDDLKAKATAAREGEAWVKADAASLPTVSAIKQTISTLTGKISEIKSNIDTLTGQRDKALADGAKSQADSEAAKGDESEKLFIAGAESRKQAALLGIQIEAAQASLVPLTQDLAAAQAHEKIVTAAADSFDETAKIYTDEYAKLKEQIDKLSALAKSLLSGDKDSLKSKAIELNALMAAADDTRGKAIQQFKAAVAHYDSAVQESDKVKSEGKRDVAPGSAEALLIKSRVEAHETPALRLRQAEASSNLAAVEASHALLLSRKIAVLASATGAATPMALTVPAELVDAKAADALKDARSAADESYKAADGTLDTVASGGSGSQQTRQAARLARAVVNAGWSQLAANAGDTENARTRLATAQELQKAVTDDPNGLTVPAYLALLTQTPVKSGATTPPPTTTNPAVESPAAPVGDAPPAPGQ